MQLSEEKSVKTTINIKKENIISAGRVINMDKLVNKDFYNIIKNKIFVKAISIHIVFKLDFFSISFMLFQNMSKYLHNIKK
jgi:hypothetical protein